MAAPSKKLLKFTDEHDEEVVIYADSIFKYTFNGAGTMIYCHFPIPPEGFQIPVFMDELLARIHANDEFEIIDINKMMEESQQKIDEEST